jgi:hypothetical protein
MKTPLSMRVQHADHLDAVNGNPAFLSTIGRRESSESCESCRRLGKKEENP